MYRSLVAVVLALGVAHSANAATITAAASAGAFDAPVSDVDGPANAGSVLAEVIDNGGGMTARAALDVNGNSAVELNGVFNNSKPHLAGITFPQVADGETSWSETLTNMSIRPKSYIYSFHLNPIVLRITDLTGDGDENDPDAPVISYRVEVRANNVVIFESQAILKGGGQSHILTETGTDLGGTFGSTEGSISYTFSAFDGTFSAGSAGPGEGVTVVAKLIAHTEAYLSISGGVVLMGDPLDLKGDPGVNSMIFEEDDSVGVEPATWSSAKQLYR